MIITRPEVTEYATYYDTYIKKVPENDLISALNSGMYNVSEFINGIPELKGDYRYAEGKWSIKEVLLHIIDAERVFAYRALRFGRNDKTPLSGFDENVWVPESNAASRDLKSIGQEYKAVRTATISLFESFHSDEPLRIGEANKNPVSVRALGYIICGHELHHVQVIKERYL